MLKNQIVGYSCLFFAYTDRENPIDYLNEDHRHLLNGKVFPSKQVAFENSLEEKTRFPIFIELDIPDWQAEKDQQTKNSDDLAEHVKIINDIPVDLIDHQFSPKRS